MSGLGAAPAGAPIAIIGIGCRFPGGAGDVESFWQLLAKGRDAITDIPRSRMDVDRFFDPRPTTPGKMVTQWGGFLEDVEEFDAESSASHRGKRNTSIRSSDCCSKSRGRPSKTPDKTTPA